MVADSDVTEDSPGDCGHPTCQDGKAGRAFDATDLPAATDDCSTPYCNATFQDLEYENQPDGTSCSGGSGFCFEGTCMTQCQAADYPSCSGDPTESEPTNDSGTTAQAFTNATCGLIDATDTDWFHFYAHDADFVDNVLQLSFWSSAPSLTVCAYVKCVDGSTPLGALHRSAPRAGRQPGLLLDAAGGELLPDLGSGLRQHHRRQR